MARRSAKLGDIDSKYKVVRGIPKEPLDYHEGLSSNQVKIILREFGLYDRLNEFDEWMYGQTCPVIQRYDESGQVREVGGVYEYDLFRWIESKKTGRAPVWD